MIAYCYKGNGKAEAYRAGQYSPSIKSCLSDALTQHIAIYGIDSKENIESLSWFCDLSAFSIESTIINHICSVDNVISEDFQMELYVGQDLRYLHYAEPIKEAIRHAIRLFALQNSEKGEWWNNDGMSFDQLEELADNVAYFIDIQTKANDKRPETDGDI